MGIFKDENGRSYGDWTHRDQRTREQANKLVTEDGEKKWYDQTFYIVAFLLLFWPVGIVLTWRSSWHLGVKIAVSIVLAIAVCFIISVYPTMMAAVA